MLRFSIILISMAKQIFFIKTAPIKLMRLFLLHLFFINYTCLIAQDSLNFISRIYVKDALGNIDSVTIGTSSFANNTFNPSFGELAITSPFDSILEVRAGHTEAIWDFEEPNYILSKKIISRSEDANEKRGGSIRLFIRAKHQPVTITWSQNFLDSYFEGTYITTDVNMFNVNPALYMQTFPLRFQCMNKFTNYTVELTSKAVLFFESPYRILRPVAGSANARDTIYGVQIVFEKNQVNSPCKLISATDEEKYPKTLYVYPNPASDFIQLSEILDSIEIYDSKGSLIKVLPGITNIPIADFSAGVYLLKGKKDNNYFRGKFFKH